MNDKAERYAIWLCLILALLSWPLLYGAFALCLKLGFPPLLTKAVLQFIRLSGLILSLSPGKSRLLTPNERLLIPLAFLIIWGAFGWSLFHCFGNPLRLTSP